MLMNVFRTAYVLRTPPYAQLIPERDRRTIARLFGTGAVTFLAGFLVWNLDNIFCSQLTAWKNLVGWPGAFLLEGHSWWHILTVRIDRKR
jgi:dihydroceramidase